jgi:hypothetical protein
MVNQTRKVKGLSMDTLEKLTKKYSVTKSGSKKQVALRLWKLKRHVMSLGDLKLIEDFGVKKNGKLYCVSGKCEEEDLN